MRVFRMVLIASLMVATIPIPAPAVAAVTPKTAVETQVQKVISTLAEPVFKDQPRENKIEKIRSIINEIFDYTELSRRTLGRDWGKFKPEQQQEFVKLFSDLLEKTYADRLLSYSNEKVVFDKENMLNESQAEVFSNVLTSDGKKIPLDYRLILKDGNWLVYDVIIEGISMVRNYRDQFRDILAKNPPEHVLKVLRERAREG
ncbi:MAG: ABC transporter substrate-binding protein [Desulfobacterales bacterium]